MMITENRSKVFLLIIGILVVTNIVLISFLLQKKQPAKQTQHQDRKAYISSFLKSEIAFDQQQLLRYDTLSDQHRQKMKNTFDKTRQSKSEQFSQLVSGGFTDSVIYTVAEKSAAAQKAMEVIQLNHLRNIRLLCRPEQLPNFDSSFGKVFKRRGDVRKKQSNN